MEVQQVLYMRVQKSNPNLLEQIGAGADVCIANISPRERLRRLVSGIIPFVFALIILTALIATQAERLWRLPLFFLFMSAAFGYFQWRDKT